MTHVRRLLAALALGALVLVPPAIRAADGDIAADAPPPSPVPSPSDSPPDYFLPPPAPVAPPRGADGDGARVRNRAGYSYDYTIYDRRYDDTITSVDAYKPLGSPNARVRPYVAASATKDSRTGGGAVPLIYSDNYAAASAGVQITTPGGLRAFAQGGASRTIGPVAAQPSGGDLRAGVQFYRDFGPVGRPHATSGNIYAGATYYSRYANAVLYAQGERVANLGGGRRPVEAYLRGVLTLDTKTFYYSNLAEATVGVRWHPFGNSGPTIALEQTGGRYLRGAIRPAGTGATYADLRPTLSVGFAL